MRILPRGLLLECSVGWLGGHLVGSHDGRQPGLGVEQDGVQLSA
jgi:hypothetical protein